MGIYPMSAESFSGFLSIGNCEGICLQKAEEMGIPDTYCSFHKALLGAVYTKLIRPPKFTAATNVVCDANYSTMSAIAGHCGIPGFLIDVPNDTHDDSIEYVEEQLGDFIKFMEELLGYKMSKERLAKAVDNTNRAVASYESYLSALETQFVSATGSSNMYQVLTSHILLGTDEAAEFYKRLERDAVRSEKSTRKRILWSIIMPFGLKTMETSFTSAGSFQLLPTDLHCDSMKALDPQNPLKSMAERLVSNHFYNSTDKRLRVLLDMAKRLRADGVVLFCHWGCKTANGSAYLLRDAIQGEGIPAIVLDGDACDRRNMSEGQFSNRLQAFFEMLEGMA